MASIKKFEPYVATNNDDVSSKGSGNPPGGGELEARVKRLEDDLKEIRSDLKTLLRDSSEVKGKIGGMPSTWQIVGIVGSMLALALAGGGSMLALVRYIQG